MDMIMRDNAVQIVSGYCNEYAHASGDDHYLELKRQLTSALQEAPTLHVFDWHEYPAEKPSQADTVYDCLCVVPQAHGTFKTELRSLRYLDWINSGPWCCDELVVVAWRQSTIPELTLGVRHD